MLFGPQITSDAKVKAIKAHLFIQLIGIKGMKQVRLEIYLVVNVPTWPSIHSQLISLIAINNITFNFF